MYVVIIILLRFDKSHGFIEIHQKDCGGWIIVMKFKVLLILQHLF